MVLKFVSGLAVSPGELHNYHTTVLPPTAELRNLRTMTLPRRALLCATLLPLAARAAEPGDTLLCPLAEPPDVLVPGVSDSIGTRLVGSNLYRGLTRLTSDGTPAPDLAEWTVAPDGLRIQFHLPARPALARQHTHHCRRRRVLPQPAASRPQPAA